MRWALPLFGALVLTACASAVRWEPIDGDRRPRGDTSARQPGPDEYRVRQGDTMYSIAFRNNLDYRQLAAWNGIGSNYLIYPGQILRLRPPGGTRAPSADPPIVAQVPGRDASAAPPGSGTPRTPVVVKAEPRSEAPLPSGPYSWGWPASGTLLRGFSLPASKGLDIAGAVGDAVYAAAPGRVVYSGSALKGYGELIIVKHDETYLSAYGYNRKRLVEEGELVSGGQKIGEMGLGPENKPILHFEVRNAGQPINPLPLLPRL